MEKEMIPFLVVSDAPSTTTGLARITRELLKRMRTDPETSSVFRIGTLGMGQCSFLSKPYPQYPGTLYADGVPELMDVWRDFSEGQSGIVMSIMNPSWMRWITDIPKRPFLLWGYFPIDCEGPSGTLPKSQLQTIFGYDRRLAYTVWAGKMINSEHIPHGIDTSVYYPRKVDKGPYEDWLTVGICATNTPRKDWALAAETCAILKHRGHKIRVLAHTDRLGHLPDLFEEFGIMKQTAMDDLRLQEDQMADWYCQCDVTLAIGAGEGFGYPIAESLACGVPVIHGRYAGGAEIAPPEMLVSPFGYRYDGLDRRPVFDANTWATRVEEFAGEPAKLGYEFEWNFVWQQWKQWLLDGVK
jgi:glycosyltransferase involved in cell wall biosynthesis